MNPVSFNYPEEATLVLINDIKMDERSRADYGDLQTLAQNIAEHGLIHPPTLSRTNNTLIAGGRRIAAMKLLGVDTIPVLYRENMSESDIVELELHENIDRKDMTWQEKTTMLYRIHKLKVREGIKLNKTWKQAETGKLLGVSTGHVSHALRIAELLVAKDSEIAACDSLPKAWQVVMERQEREAMKAVAERSGALPVSTPTPKASDGAVVINLDTGTNADELIASTQDLLTSPKPSTQVSPQSAEKFQVDLANMFFNGDCIEIMKSMPAQSVDHVVTDIPYGIDMSNLDTLKNLGTVVDTHDVKQNVEMMPRFLAEAYRVMKDGFLVFWYDLDHHQKLVDWATKVGFKVQRWNLVWCKTHPCRNSSANKNFTKRTEVALVCRKGDANLHKPNASNFIACDGLAEKKLYSNPFAKPFDVWKFILETIAYKGQIILDPYGGQMSCPRACINLGLIPRAIEIDPYHFFHGVDMIKNLYQEMTSNSAEFISDPTKGLKFNDPTEWADPDAEGELPY